MDKTKEIQIDGQWTSLYPFVNPWFLCASLLMVIFIPVFFYNRTEYMEASGEKAEGYFNNDLDKVDIGPEFQF